MTQEVRDNDATQRKMRNEPESYKHIIKRIVLFTLELKDWPESNTDDRVTTNAECEDAIVRVRRRITGMVKIFAT